jgi:hypothetical protein
VNSGRLAEPATYDASPIVAPGHGWVAPDVRLADGARLRDRLGTGFAVVAGAPVPGRETLVTDDPRLGSRALIVRPDGHVADSAPVAETDDLDRRLERAISAARRAKPGRGMRCG